MDKKLIFNEHGERGTQSMIGGNTQQTFANGTVSSTTGQIKCTVQCSTTSGFQKRFP